MSSSTQSSLPGQSNGRHDAQGMVLPAPVPLAAIWPWLLFVPVLLLAIYFIGAEEGATSIFQGTYIHEFVHDARHLLGFPCH